MLLFLFSASLELSQPRVCTEELVLSDQDLSQRNSSLAQQNEEPLLIREEQKEPPSPEARDRDMFLLKEETDPLMSPANKESDHSQNQTLHLSFNGTQTAAKEELQRYLIVKLCGI